MKTILRNLPNDILYGISVNLLYIFLLYAVKDVHPYFSYLFLFVASTLSIFILSPTLYLTPLYYIFSRLILLFIFSRVITCSGGTIFLITYISPNSPQNPFLKHNLLQSYILSQLQYRLNYLTKSLACFQTIISLPQILIIIFSTLPFLFVKRETKSLIEISKFKPFIFIFIFGALIAIPSDYLLMFLILKGIGSIYILPIVLFIFSIIPSLLLTNKLFPYVKDIRIIFIPIVSLFFFYIITSGGMLLFLPIVLFEGLVNIFVIAFPYFEMPLLVSGILAYAYIKNIPKN